MGTQVASRSVGALSPPRSIEDQDTKGRAPSQAVQDEAATVFAQVPPARADVPASDGLDISDAWKLALLCLPKGGQAAGALRDIVVPPAIAGDGRRRLAFKVGVHAARELGLDVEGIDAEDLMALGRQTVTDHAMSGTPDGLLVAVARLEGKVDDAAWAARDTDKVAAQVDAFLRSEFKDEIDLYQALDALAVEPPLLSRGELAHALLREQGVDPDALLDDVVDELTYPSVSASSPPLVRNTTAGEHYFNQDTLTAAAVRKMKTPGGTRLTAAQADRLLRALPASLDAEFTRRFDHHRQRMSTLLAQWLSARVSLHSREAGIGLGDAVVSVSRARMRLFSPPVGMRIGAEAKYSDVYGNRPSRGFLVDIQSAQGRHQCFISTHTGAVHVLPAGESAETWLRKEHELAFDDAAAFAELATRPGRWLARVTVEQKASGPHAAIRDTLFTMFETEIEQGRETARGETRHEATVDALLNLIPFRAMVVALRKGDIPTAILMGGLDTLSLIPLIGSGIRLTGAAARSATPWLAMGMRFGGAAGRQGWNSLRRLAGGMPALRDRIRGSLAGSAVQGWGRLRPLDVQRVAQALRPTAPRLADMLDGIAVRSRGPTIPDGVWRVRAAAASAAETRDAVTAVPTVTARNMQGSALSLLPYGERAGAYTQVDAMGRRIGALLLADSGGWLHRTLPVASLERYRVATPAVIETLAQSRMGPDGTIGLNGDRYARLGADYVQLAADPAVSTASRPIWRVVPPQGVLPDVVVHRLFHDAREGLWRHADAPMLAGGGNQTSGVRRRGAVTAAAPAAPDAHVVPGTARVARFQQALMDGVRDATPDDIDALRALMDRVASDARGRAIIRAMTAHHEVFGRVPEIVQSAGAEAAPARPSLDEPVRGNTWHLDLDRMQQGTTEAAVDELAAVYNNMTGILQDDDPFQAVLAQGEPAVDPALEQAWADWRAQAPAAPASPGAEPGQPSVAVAAREQAVDSLRGQVREMMCYGGLDRSALKSVLRKQPGNWAAKIDLSRRGLDSVPPLPRDTKVLVISHNPVRDWRNLPQGLVVLDAEATNMVRLPENLPDSLLDLDVSDNLLRKSKLQFPPRLMYLDIGRNRLQAVPRLPATLTRLAIDGNQLFYLPDNLPKGLRLLDVSNNALTELPAKLPSRLKVLLANANRLARLPASLPNALEDLDVSDNLLCDLPALPDTLRILEVGSNLLETLPEKLPRGLEMLLASRNLIRRLPEDLPTGLLVLALRNNAIAELPASITALESSRIHLDGNPLAMQDLPIIAPDRAGPRIYFFMHTTADRRPQYVRTLIQALQHWLTSPSEAARFRWEVIARAMGERDNATQFSLFLDVLRGTVSYRDAGFRTQVEDWLVELSKPERRALLDDTLGICQGAAETCEDRIISVWNDMQTLRLNDDVRQGLYDRRMPDVVAIARQMFRINVLTDIARRKERTLSRPDEIEVYLSYVVKLRDPLGLTTIAPGMRYYNDKDVTAEDLETARETVLAREREEFDKFLVLDYEPWQTLLKRKDAQAYAQAEERAHRQLEAFEQRLREEIDKLGLDAADAALLEDARKDLGPGIMRQIRYEAMSTLTDRYVRAEVPA